MWRGLSFLNASPIAGSRIAGSVIVVTGMRLRVFDAKSVPCTWICTSVKVAGVHREMLDDGAERESGEEGEAADDQDHADQQADEQRPPSVGNVPADGGTIFFAASEPATASIGTIIRKRPISIAKPSRRYCRRACWR